MEKLVFIIVLLIITLFNISLCNKPTHNVETTSIDTVYVNKTDTLVFNTKTISIKYLDRVHIDSINTEVVKFIRIDSTEYVYINSYDSSLADVKLYTDSLSNDDGVFYSNVMTSGTLYSNYITYILKQPVITKTQDIKTSKRLFKHYVGTSIMYSSKLSLDSKLEHNFDIAPIISVSINKHLISYQYGLFNQLHTLTYQHSLYD